MGRKTRCWYLGCGPKQRSEISRFEFPCSLEVERSKSLTEERGRGASKSLEPDRVRDSSGGTGICQCGSGGISFSIASRRSLAGWTARLASSRATSSRSADWDGALFGRFPKFVEPERQAKVLGLAGEFRFDELTAKALDDFEIAVAEFDRRLDDGSLAPVVPGADLDEGQAALEGRFERRWRTSCRRCRRSFPSFCGPWLARRYRETEGMRLPCRPASAWLPCRTHLEP